MGQLEQATRRELARFLAREIPRWHYRLWRVSRGRIGSRLRGVEFCLLTTTGRLTGRRRTKPLVLIRTNGRLVLVASNGGSDRHPAWFMNLLASPKALIQTRTDRFAVMARIADPRERDELWPTIVETYSGYRNYREKTEREIPVVILDRLV